MVEKAPNIVPLITMTAGAGYAAGEAMLGLGLAIGHVVREARNDRNLAGWHAAVQAKSNDVESSIDELDGVRKSGLLNANLVRLAVSGLLQFRQEHRDAFDAPTVFDAFDQLDALSGRIRSLIERLQASGSQSANAMIMASVRKRIDRIRADHA